MTRAPDVLADNPLMVHYLFQMHRDGKVLLRMELNVPTTVFETLHDSALLGLETMLQDRGLRQGLLEATSVAAPTTGEETQ